MAPAAPRDLAREWWDADAGGYDAAPGHSMSDPVEAAAWAGVLTALLPPPPAAILDAGVGTGSLSLLAAMLGHRVTGFDLSEAMLAVAEAKAADRGVEVSFTRADATDPPDGPFDAIIERHVVWTLPDPTAALSAWRSVATPSGRLVLLEGSWGGEGPFVDLKDGAARVLRRVWGMHDDHHASYPEEIVRAAPLAGLRSPGPFIDAVHGAGWRDVRLFRLRDVEWAIERRTRWPLGWLTRRPRYAIVADA